MDKREDKLNLRIANLWASQYMDGEYGPSWYRVLAKYSPNREAVAVSIAKKIGGRLLDVGCGDGNLLIELSNYFTHLIGIDLIPYRIRRAEARIARANIKNVSVGVANIENGLSFKSGSFDVVTCLGVLEYTFDPEYTLNQMLKVLKSGGTLILEVPNIGFVGERLTLLFGGLPNVAHAEGWQGGRLHNFTQSTLEHLIKENGFEVVDVLGSGFLYRIRSFWPSLLSGDLIFICKKR